MTTPAPVSYASGTSATPLLGTTIDGNLKRTVAATPIAKRSSTSPPVAGSPTPSWTRPSIRSRVG